MCIVNRFISFTVKAQFSCTTVLQWGRAYTKKIQSNHKKKTYISYKEERNSRFTDDTPSRDK